MITRSFTVNGAREIPAALDAQITGSFDPVMAFVFTSPRQDIRGIADAFAGRGLDVIGTTSGGNILADGSEQVIYEEAIVITLVQTDRDNYAYLAVAQDDLSEHDFGLMIGNWCSEQFEKPHIIIVASGIGKNGQELMEGILDIAGWDTTMFGGMAGDEVRFSRSYVFSSGEILECGAIALAFDPKKVEIHGLATSGWVGLGKDLNITAAESNVVFSIDNQPALDVYKKYLNVKDTDLPAIGVEYPLLVKRDDENFALRAVMGVDLERKALIFAGTVPEDSIVTFSSSPGFEVIDRTCDRVRDFHRQHPEADMILLFSCMARHLALGPVITEEISLPFEKWQTTVSGFFTYGEIGTNENLACDFYNQTYSLVILKEK